MTGDLNNLIAIYRENAEAHERHSVEGDYERANANHDRLIEALRKIRSFGSRGNEAIMELMEDDCAGVRGWAATHSLRYDEERSVITLKELAGGHGPVALDAEMALREWEKGTLNTP